MTIMYLENLWKLIYTDMFFLRLLNYDTYVYVRLFLILRTIVHINLFADLS